MTDTVTIYGISIKTRNPLPESFVCAGHDRPGPTVECAGWGGATDREYHSATDVTKPPCDNWPWALR